VSDRVWFTAAEDTLFNPHKDLPDGQHWLDCMGRVWYKPPGAEDAIIESDPRLRPDQLALFDVEDAIYERAGSWDSGGEMRDLREPDPLDGSQEPVPGAE
jgi:hypothetical protein